MGLPLGTAEPILPTLPAVVARVVAVYASEDHTPARVVAVLETDPPIASRVLRLANSPYYGFGGRVETLSRATVLLGAAAVQAVALGVGLLRAWGGGAVPGAVEGVWVHSYLCALGCRYLGRRLPRGNGLGSPDALFLAGLLHDVGKIWFLTRDPAGYAGALGEAAGAPLRLAEGQRFGQDHAAAGGELATAWGLPARLIALIRHHHGPALRAELAADARVLAAANGAAGGEGELAPELPEGLAADLAAELLHRRPEAEGFFRAIA